MRDAINVIARSVSDGAIHTFYAARWIASLALAMTFHDPEPSSSAKAGDPVFRDANDGIEKPQRTGYPAFAGMTAEYGDAP